MIEHIVVPFDFTPESDRALLVARNLAGWAAARIELVSVVEPLERADVEPALADVAAGLGDSTTCRVVESGGSPEAALLTELHRDEKALWCVGSHARGGLAELLRGSVSENLVRESCSSVPTSDARRTGGYSPSHSTGRTRARSSCPRPPISRPRSG